MVQNQILIVEDDENLREAIDDTLELAGYNRAVAVDAESAIALLQHYMPDAIVSDINMPGMNGFDFLKILGKKLPNVPVLLMTAYGNITDAVKAMHEGATDYFTKPFEPQVLLEKLAKILPSPVEDEPQPIAEDPQSKQLLALALKIADSDISVLISGASGTGKEVLARYIHDSSDRKNNAFVAVNCAAIPDNMLEANLFGYEKGAFTGALRSHPGKFEQAQQGTLLLDEISEMDLNLQAKLLRVLQEKEVERLGSAKMISLDVRVIATTNRDLKQEVAEGRFREDLYYRLNVFPLHWIPLRERRKDILPLAQYLLAKHAQLMNKSLPLLSQSGKAKMLSYSWPGNAREMDNVIQRTLVLLQSDSITEDDIILDENLSKESENTAKPTEQSQLHQELRTQEYDMIVKVLTETGGDRQKMAESLGISPRTLRYKLAKMRKAGMSV